MFTTITQALQYLEQCKLEASSSKIMYVAKGYYNEKLEINIPNPMSKSIFLDKSSLLCNVIPATKKVAAK